MIVYKIGGSLLRDAAHFIRAADFIAGLKPPAVVVVSAIKGVTDMLLELARTRSYLMYEEILHRHIAVARALGVEEAIQPLLRELNKALRLPHSDWAADYFASFGERLSAAILHSYLARRGVKTALSVAPLLTDSNYGNAEPYALAERIDPSAVTIATGFIGRDKEGKFTTVGRGGSDYTATFLGAALGARKVVLITDAPGVMTGNPQEVDDPLVLPLLSLEEALEASKAGAKNFHPKTFKPVLSAPGMIVEVRNYTSRGTLIGPFYAPPPFKIVTKCGADASCVIGIAAEELTKLGGDLLDRYTARLSIPPRHAHEHLIKPNAKYIKSAL